MTALPDLDTAVDALNSGADRLSSRSQLCGAIATGGGEVSEA